MFDSVRGYVLDEVDPAARGWRRVDEQRLPATIDRETVVVRHMRVVKLPAAPIGHLSHELILGIFVPNRDLAKAEDRLDDAVRELLEEIDGHERINWTQAEKVVTPDNQYPGWEITLTVITLKTPPESEPTP